MIIVIAKSQGIAAAVSGMVGDRLRPGQLVWASCSLDIRAVRQAIALAGGGAVAIGPYQFGLASGFVMLGLLVSLYQAAVPLGEALYEWQANAAAIGQVRDR